jgi:hypothetical protein
MNNFRWWEAGAGEELVNLKPWADGWVDGRGGRICKSKTTSARTGAGGTISKSKTMGGRASAGEELVNLKPRAGGQRAGVGKSY